MQRPALAALVLIGGAALAFSNLAHADTPGADWMTKDQVTKKLTDLGYTNVRKLEADDGHWEGDATKDGASYEIHVDPHSGALTKTERKDKDDD